jgi:transcriptional regulator with XRE-family HTH domain
MTFNEARKAAGLTQWQMALEIGCSLRSVAHWCSGRRNVNVKFLQRARKALSTHGVEWGPGVCQCCGRPL